MEPIRPLLFPSRRVLIGSHRFGETGFRVFRALSAGFLLLIFGIAPAFRASAIQTGATPSPSTVSGASPAGSLKVPAIPAIPVLPLPHPGWRLRGVALGQPPLAFAPDGATLLAHDYDVVQDDERLVLWDLNSGRVGRVWPHAGPAGPLAVSPDGKAVARAPGSGTRIEFWDSRTGQFVRTLSRTGDDTLGLPPGATIESLAYGADGTTLLAGYAAEGSAAHALGLSGILELDAKTGRERRRVQFAGWAAQCLAVSEDGRLVAAAGLGPVITVLRGGAGGSAMTIRTGERRIEALGFNAAGTTLYVLASPDRLSAWDAETGAPVGSPVGLTQGRACRLDGSFSRDGRWLATENLTLRDGETEIVIWDLAGLPSNTSPLGD